jgi:hypothetical protein
MIPHAKPVLKNLDIYQQSNERTPYNKILEAIG